jgi:uncharacterized protein (DUF58 family)
MHGSRRFWTTAAVAGSLAVVAVLTERPEPLVGAAGIGAWLLAAQVVALRDFERAASVTVTYEADRRRAGVDQPIRARLLLERQREDNVSIEATAPLPLAADGPAQSARTVTLEPGTTRANITFEFAIPVAGQFTPQPPTIELRDRFGLFIERLSRGDAPTVDVSADAPRDIHIGQGGERIIAAYGEHATDRRGPGLQPEELRQYMPGDPADSIDWKATARLDETYVREYRAETDRETLLVLDHRARMGYGPGGETMLAYAREVALAVATSAIDASDPLGLYAVGDEGLTTRRRATTDTGGYVAIRSALQALQPTAPTGEPTSTAVQPARSRRLRERLRPDASQFGTALGPFLQQGDAYVRRLAGDPLFGAVQALVEEADSNQWTVILTSDEDPIRLRETVRLAAGRSAAVLVFITPRVLYEQPDDLEAAYDRYVSFEDLRRDLDRLPRVTAFEVGPGDRVQRLLADRRARTAGT